MRWKESRKRGTVVIVTFEQAMAQGLRGWQIRNAAKWHKQKAGESKQGRDKERHFKFAVDLNRVAAKMEENGKP